MGFFRKMMTWTVAGAGMYYAYQNWIKPKREERRGMKMRPA